jgi:DNA (cytosine-5)-methyltransferase 1
VAQSFDPVPVIDIFAGPGGLGEGFSRAVDCQGRQLFKICLSIEKDAWAHRTLELRSFMHQFAYGHAPDEYYAYLRCAYDEAPRVRQLLFARYADQAECAQREAWHATLGETSSTLVSRRIEEALGTQHKHWVLIGGPPCQAYSLVGRSRMKRVMKSTFYKDHRHTLYKEYLRILADHGPTIFIMENVKGLLSSKLKGERIFQQILSDLAAPGPNLSYRIYSITAHPDRSELFVNGANDPDHRDYIVEAERYGVPQARHRLILVGVNSAFLKQRPAFVPPVLKKHKVIRTTDAAIAHLPPVRSQISTGDDSKTEWKTTIRNALLEEWYYDVAVRDPTLARRLRSVVEDIVAPRSDCGSRFVACSSKSEDQELAEWFHDPKMSGVCNHESRSHLPSDLHRYLFASVYAHVHHISPRLGKFPRALLPKHKNVKRALGNGMFNDRFRVQRYGVPATTITSHIAKDGHYFIHPDPKQCRSLTVREAARLQTFPDNYFFEGPRTEQYHQVGNAVPPLLAHQIAALVANILVPERVGC